jgi:hypothetical protein
MTQTDVVREGSTMAENRRQVLEMLAAGRVTAEEADRLLSALGEEQTPAVRQAPLAKPRYLRILVDAKDGEEGPVKVNIRVPVALLRAGVRLASLVPEGAQVRINAALREKGVPLDISQIRPENLNELIDHLGELTVDVDQTGEKENVKVRIFCE